MADEAGRLSNRERRKVGHWSGRIRKRTEGTKPSRHSPEGVVHLAGGGAPGVLVLVQLADHALLALHLGGVELAVHLRHRPTRR